MDIHSFHEKASARAKALSEKLGIELKTPDINEVQNKAAKKLEIMLHYSENKEQYDAVMDKLLGLISPEEIQKLIQKVKKTEE